MAVVRISKELAVDDAIRKICCDEKQGMLKLQNSSTSELYGFLDYSLIEGAVTESRERRNIFRINMIKVFEKYRRRGYATLMVKYVKTRYKGYTVDLNTTTLDGMRFFTALGIPIKKVTVAGTPTKLLRSGEFH